MAIQFWDREVGATWLSFERQKIIEFSKIRANQDITISGYVKWITDSLFALVPTLFSNQSHLLCVNNTEKNPSENSYVVVSGVTRFEYLKQRKGYPDSRIFNGQIILSVNDLKKEKPNFKIPKTYFDYKNFKRDLTRRFDGLDSQLEDFLAFTAISAPPLNDYTGGINLAMYDSTKGQSSRFSMSRLLSQEMKLAIPDGIGGIGKVVTPFGSIKLGYKYAFFSEDANSALSKPTLDLLSHKKSNNLPDCSEASVSLYSSKEKPIHIEDAPCSLSDIPTVVPEQTTFYHKKRSIDPFDSLEFIASNHMKTPVIEDQTAALTTIADKLEILATDFKIDDKHLANYGFLNANFNGRPLSILRNSLSLARSDDIDTVSIALVEKVFNDYFKWNFEYVYDIWDDLLNKPRIGDKTLDSVRIKFREIIRIIRRYYSSGSPGASRQSIIDEAKTTSTQTEQLIDECCNSGLIYEPVPGYYRLTRSDA